MNLRHVPNPGLCLPTSQIGWFVVTDVSCTDLMSLSPKALIELPQLSPASCHSSSLSRAGRQFEFLSRAKKVTQSCEKTSKRAELRKPRDLPSQKTSRTNKKGIASQSLLLDKPTGQIRLLQRLWFYGDAQQLRSLPNQLTTWRMSQVLVLESEGQQER